MLMRAQTEDWPSGLASMVVKKLYDKFESQDNVSLIDMNHLKQQTGLKTPESNPQTMFEQIAALENQFKTPMSDSEKIAIAIEKLPAEYQPVLIAEMRKEGSMLTATHIENTAFQYGIWFMVCMPRIWSSMWQMTKIFRVGQRSCTCSIQWNLQQMWSQRTQGGRMLHQEAYQRTNLDAKN